MQLREEMAKLRANWKQFEEALAEEVRQMKDPLNDRLQNISKEKEMITRQLQRYEALYRELVSEHTRVLEEHKEAIFSTLTVPSSPSRRRHVEAALPRRGLSTGRAGA